MSLDRKPGERVAFWLTYHPPTGDFFDYDRAVQLTRSGKVYEDTWQVAHNNPLIGDRVFILRQGNNKVPGRPSRGIVARGIAIRASKKGSWNRDGSGPSTYRVKVRLDSVVGPDETPVEDPFYPVLPGHTYAGPQRSGTRITDPSLLRRIEDQWSVRFDAPVLLTNGIRPAEAERERIWRTILDRRGQALFRAALLDAYKGKCAITDCDAEEALEAAHIVPCFENGEDRIQNGLLLRADVHTLFDLDLLWIDPDTRRVALAQEIAGGCYKRLEGKPLGENQVNPDLRAGTIELRWRFANRRTIA